ncbi:Homeobox domain-like,HTH CenpB-type DNA-binding domain [Cinara cedri]|uniref:Homeobox domain-like,HTH CenpB-type DNA-binding domain n=1 Tax=Cinara cedri TaxID=506608 RepID=A0A5E4MQV8_9HEMI|nr:Homeobox domain-like,HTH CenpB-type DNA-binding domain [Cinara cedri]
MLAKGHVGHERLQKIRPVMETLKKRFASIPLEEALSIDENVPLTGPLIREKALEFSKMLEVENFQATVGWLNRFQGHLSTDDNVLTCYELNIMQSIKDSKDEATDESSEDEEAVMGDDVRNVTSSEALLSLEVMRIFISSRSDKPDFISTNIHQLQNYLKLFFY